MPNQVKNAEKRSRAFFNGKTVLVFLAVLMTVATGVLAKYVWETQSEYAQISSPPFYFTADVLGDSVMSVTENGEYSYDDKQIRSWDLYGGGEHEINIELRNYYDELRVTQEDIAFTVKVTENASVNKNSGSFAANEDGTYAQQSDTLKLTIPSGYKEGDEVAVTVASTSPYKKTIELSFKLHVSDHGLTYRVVDAVYSPYAELEIMNGTDNEAEITLNWNISELFIDNTNELTFNVGSDGIFTPQEGTKDGNMKLSRPLKANESVSIFFFKNDTSRNYSTADTAVGADKIIAIAN